MQNAGAIASTLAADLYGMEIIAESIETHKQNFTRFLLLRRPELVPVIQGQNKASICFTLKHEVGSLHNVLGALTKNNANLTKIQSFPIPNEGWHYSFFVDFIFNQSSDYENSIYEIANFTEELSVLGIYQMGENHDN